MKLLILGYNGVGKTTIAEILCTELGLRYIDSSRVALEKIVYPWFQRALPNMYLSAEECYLDRGNCRPIWYQTH